MRSVLCYLCGRDIALKIPPPSIRESIPTLHAVSELVTARVGFIDNLSGE